MNEKTVLILGAGLMQKPALRAAKELGFTTAAVDGNPAALCASLADIFMPVDLKDKDGILKFAQSLRGVYGRHGFFRFRFIRCGKA